MLANGTRKRLALDEGEPLCPAQRLTEADDQRAGEQEGCQRDQVPRSDQFELSARFNEQVRTREVAENGDRYPRPDASQLHCNGHGTEQGDERYGVNKQWIERPAQPHRERHRDDGNAVGNGRPPWLPRVSDVRQARQLDPATLGGQVRLLAVLCDLDSCRQRPMQSSAPPHSGGWSQEGVRFLPTPLTICQPEKCTGPVERMAGHQPATS
jgi:hypothetical protein